MSNDIIRAAAWDALAAAARAFAEDKQQAQRLSDAAKAWADASKPPRAKSAVLVPFGRSKGKTLDDADTKDLRWLAEVALPGSIADESKARFRASNEELLEAILAELETR